MYHVADSQGRGYEALFMLMHILGAWFLVNLMVAVLGASFEREQMRQKVAHEERKRAVASLRDSEKAAPHWLEEYAGYYGRAYILPFLRKHKAKVNNETRKQIKKIPDSQDGDSRRQKKKESLCGCDLVCENCISQ